MTNTMNITPLLIDGKRHYLLEYGTIVCEWAVSEDGTAYQIVSVLNTDKGNGHFALFLDEMKRSCVDDGRNLEVLYIHNQDFYKHLLKKHNFVERKCPKKGVYLTWFIEKEHFIEPS